MANSIPIQTLLAKRALRVLRNKATMIASVNRDFQTDISASSARANGIINIKKPPRYVGRTGEIFKPESSTIPTISTQLVQYGQDLSFSLLDLQLSTDDVMNGGADVYLEPAINTIVGQIEAAGTALYRRVGNVVGSATVMPNTTLIPSTAGALITSLGGMQSGDRTAHIDPFLNASLADSLKLYPNPQAEVGKAYLNGYMGRGVGFDFFDNAFIQTHTAGVFGGTPLINGAAQSGATIVTNGWTAGSILNAGDTLTFAGVFGVNPTTRASTGRLYGHAVAATATADGAGNMTITLVTGTVATGAFQNVTALPATSAAIVVTSGTTGAVTKQSLLFDKDAFTFACVPMAKVPAGLGAMSETVKDKESGLAITMTQFYNGETNQVCTRFDVLAAWLDTYPELAVRVMSPAS